MTEQPQGVDPVADQGPIDPEPDDKPPAPEVGGPETDPSEATDYAAQTFAPHKDTAAPSGWVVPEQDLADQPAQEGGA